MTYILFILWNIEGFEFPYVRLFLAYVLEDKDPFLMSKFCDDPDMQYVIVF